MLKELHNSLIKKDLYNKSTTSPLRGTPPSKGGESSNSLHPEDVEGVHLFHLCHIVMYFIIILTALFSNIAYSQTDCLTDPPLPPLLTSVSVIPETGFTEIKWNLSLSTGISAYVLYSLQNEDAIPIDTLWDNTATNYTLFNTVTKYNSASYLVAAMRLPRCTSILSNVLSAIFTEASIDTCNNKISVKWNKYNSYPIEVTDYSVLVSVNGASFTEAAKVSPDLDNFTMNEYITEAEYCFVVRANLANGTKSTSNKICLLTNSQRPPAWINADQATVGSDNEVILDFSIDPLSEINRYRLEKMPGPSGNYEQIAQINSDNGSVHYSDKEADIKIVNYYRLSAINNCNIPVTFSNISSNIVLRYERNGNDLNLSWNSYKNWNGAVASYRLFINLGPGYEEKLNLPATDTVCTIDYNEIKYDVASNELCFYIKASEIDNPYGINGESISSRACSEPTEIVTVPNLFTPDNDLVNDFFSPVLSFTPIDYHLLISDRKGNIVFETRDYYSPWDGTQNGNPLSQGVYLWLLKVTTPSGKGISKTGTITIFRSH